MARFVGALVLLLAAINSVHGRAFVGKELTLAAKHATQMNPQLRSQEQKRKNNLNNQIRAMARVLNEEEEEEEDEGQNYQNQQNGYNEAAYYDGYGNEMYYNQYLDEADFGFDITSYAVKYTGCRTIESYSDRMAEDAYSDAVLVTQRFATFRLCEVEKCSSYNNMGCATNYGEYVVHLDHFIRAILDFNEQRVVGYCQYCDRCANIESFKLFYNEVQYVKAQELATADAAYEDWQTAYGSNYQNNNYNNNNNNNNGYYQEDDYDMQIAYYQYLRKQRNNQNNNQQQNNYQNYNNNNGQYYANNYQNGQNGQYAGYGDFNEDGQNWWETNQANQNDGNQWTYSQAFWDIQNMQYKQKNNQQSWYNMGTTNYGTFYGQDVWNGYWNEYNQFTPLWGYWNKYGEYISIEDEDALIWDKSLFGEFPDGNWNENWLYGYADLQSCNKQYAASCYNQYDACMQIMGNEEWMQYMTYQNGYNWKAQRQQGTLKDFLECKEINMYNAQGNGASNYQDQYVQQYYQKMYQEQQYQQAQQNEAQQAAAYYQYYCNEGDENCEGNQDYAMQQYQKQQQWEQNKAQYEQKQWQLEAQKGFWIGPKCDENGHDISIAVYRDEFCSSAAEDVTVEDILGYDPLQVEEEEDDEVDLFPNQCIPCGMNDDATMWYEDEAFDYGDIAPICSILYQFSGKCNKNLKPNVVWDQFGYDQYGNRYQNYNNRNYNQYNNYNQNANNNQNGNNNNNQNGNNNNNQNGDNAEAEEEQMEAEQFDWEQMYRSRTQAQNEANVCSFIKSLNSGTYDENGQVYLDDNPFRPWRNPSKWKSEYENDRRNMSGGMKAALSLTAIAAAAMGAYACMLHGKLARKNIPWRPRLARKNEDPVTLVRQNSGIVMGRSRSGPSTAPLI